MSDESWLIRVACLQDRVEELDEERIRANTLEVKEGLLEERVNILEELIAAKNAEIHFILTHLRIESWTRNALQKTLDMKEKT